MPFKSLAQQRLFQGVAHDSIKKPGLSKRAAIQFVADSSGDKKKLPERVGQPVPPMKPKV